LLLRKGGRTERGVAVDAEGPLQKMALGMRLGGWLLRRKKEEKEKLRKKEEKGAEAQKFSG
jgi:outer membrane receptor for ferrienterochelin and colicin